MKNRADHITIKELGTSYDYKGIIIRFRAEYNEKEIILHTYIENAEAAQLISEIGDLLNINLLKQE